MPDGLSCSGGGLTSLGRRPRGWKRRDRREAAAAAAEEKKKKPEGSEEERGRRVEK